MRLHLFVHTLPGEVVLGALTIPGIKKSHNTVMHHNDIFSYKIQHID